MLSYFRMIAGDACGLMRVGGAHIAIKWVWAVVWRWRACRETRSLRPADDALGCGPFRVRMGNAVANLFGPHILSSIREIWCRDAYLGDGFLTIPPDACVVDLGANMGTFSVLALAHGPNVRLAAVEADHREIVKWHRSIAVNRFQDRAQMYHCFIGGTTASQEWLAGDMGQDVPHLSEEDFISRAGFSRIDLVKCDIEGSEFGLLTPDSLLLRMTRQIAIEVHDRAGDRGTIIETLRRLGFEVVVRRASPTDCIVIARRPT